MENMFLPPFSDQILLKRKKLRRELLAKQTDWQDKKIAILGGSTTHDIKDILELYDAFETVIEAWLPDLRSMTVSLSENGIRMAMDLKGSPTLPELPLPVGRKTSEGITYLTIDRRTGGDAS